MKKRLAAEEWLVTAVMMRARTTHRVVSSDGLQMA